MRRVKLIKLGKTEQEFKLQDHIVDQSNLHFYLGGQTR